MKRIPLILLPGLNNSIAVFDEVVPALDKAIGALAFDLPPLDDIEVIAGNVLARCPDRFFLCGFSFGGYVALAMLGQAPDRIAGLALVGALPGADSDAQRTNRETAITAAETGGYEAMVEANAPAAFHPDSLGNVNMMVRRAKMVADYGSARFVAHSRAAMARPDRSGALAGFAGPLIMLAGDRDPLTPKERLYQIAGEERAHVIAGAGHLLPMEQPLALAQRLSAWLLAINSE